MTATFLADRDGRTWDSDRIDQPATYHLGEGPSQLEVVVTAADGRPTKAQLQRLYRLRRDGRANPVLAVVDYSDSWAERLGPEHTQQTETAETDD